MALVDFTLEGHVAVMTMNSGENRLNPPFLEAFTSALDEIEQKTEATVIVVRSAHEKIWSNGLDLDWLITVANKPEEAKPFFLNLMAYYRRILMSPCLTIACINGHAFAGGAIGACAYDFRFMRTDRGFYCFPEVDINIPFLPGMMALLKTAMPPATLNEMTLTGKRLTADQAVAAGLVMGAAHNDELMDTVMNFAKSQNKKRATVLGIKNTLYAEAARIIDTEDTPIIESGRLYV